MQDTMQLEEEHDSRTPLGAWGDCLRSHSSKALCASYAQRSIDLFKTLNRYRGASSNV